MSTPYDFKPGGSLKLKGDKPKKKKSKSSDDRALIQREVERSAREAELQAQQQRASESASGGRGDSPSAAAAAAAAAATTGDGLAGVSRQRTAAEEKWERVQEQRRKERARKMAKMTHKDRVAEFNASLDRLSEHHDLPKIGPG